ncbi:MAG: amino acid adenylation domain-containing protein, partial [Thermoanaerobaculia bacterium]
TVAGLAVAVDEAREVAGEASRAPAIEPAPREGPLPLSFAQQRLWFLDQLEPGSAAYNVAQAVRLRGPLDAAALAWSLGEAVRRHESLRTVFETVEGEPAQRILLPAPVPLPVVDLSEVSDPLSLAREEARRPFDLARGPLLRAVLLRLGPEEHQVLLTMHHIVSDGWSAGILVREVAALYEARLRGEGSPLPELAVQYADFAVWQRRWLAGEVLARQLAYWRGRLAGAPAVLELPADRPRPAVQTSAGATLPLALTQELSAALRKASRREGVTPFMTLLAGFQALLARYSNTGDVIVGSPIAGRRHLETEGLIGFFVNTLVLRGDLSRNPGFGELLRRTREVTLEAHAHQDVPFERLVEELRPERSLAHSPLFQVMLSLQEAPLGALRLAGLTLEAEDLDTEAVKFDLNLALVQTADGFTGRLSYNTSLFLPATAARLLGHFQALLGAAVADPALPVSELPLLSEAERGQLLREWNDTRLERTVPVPIHERFAARAAENPEAPAVAFEGETLSYGELDRRANRAARRLRALGVGPDVPAALFTERSADMVVGLLAVLKAGGAYVPIDPAFPDERVAWVLADAGVPVVLTQSALAGRLPAGLVHLLLDREIEESGEVLGVAVDPEHLAYVIYTSGSTGRPKGVMVGHRQLDNYVQGVIERLDLGECRSFATVSTLAADLGNTAVFPALATGACLHVISSERASDAYAFAEYFERHAVDVLKIVPSHLAALQAMPRKRLVLGGEASTWEEVERLQERAPGCRIFNHYGPTETTVGVLTYPVRPTETLSSTVPLGRPLPGSRVVVLDAFLHPAPLGVPGELCIGGEGLARGYLGRPDLTAERFVPDPFHAWGGRLYRTGDLARVLPDGGVEFLGRIDTQVKIRGFRVELEEVAAVLKRHPGVREAVTAVRERRLVAYLVAGEDVSEGALRALLREALPDYMVPSAFVRLSAIPLTPNGKVDHRALPLPEGEPEESFLAPRTPAEELLAGLWSELLGIRRVGARDDFFALGGHSLLATQLHSRLRQAFGVSLPLRALFEAPTVAELAERIEAARREARAFLAPPLVHAERPSELPLSFAQERLWFLDQLDPGQATYNLPYFARVRGPLDPAVLAAALGEVVRRHESLRTRFPAVSGRPVQAVDGPSKTRLAEVDLRILPEEMREAEAGRLLEAEARRPFDLDRGPLLRSALLRLEEDESVLLLSMHHIVSDGWSRGVLVREVAALYEALAAGRPSPLPELTVQYADFALWQRAWLQGEALEAELAWWRERLAGAPPSVQLPADRPRPAVRSGRGGSRPVLLPAGLSKGAKDLARREGATPFMVLLAAFDALLHRYSGQDDLVVGSPVANRNRREVEGLIGFFVNTLALRVGLAGDPGFRELVERVREVALGAYDHQDLPFERLVEAVTADRSLNRAPLFQVLFLLQNAPMPALEFAGLAWTPVEAHNGAAKFDLTLALWDDGQGLAGAVEYDSDLFDGATAARLARH